MRQRYLSEKCANLSLTGKPCWRIRMVCSMPEYLSCSRTHGMSSLSAALSVLGLMQRTNQGLHLRGRSWVSEWVLRMGVMRWMGESYRGEWLTRNGCMKWGKEKSELLIGRWSEWGMKWGWESYKSELMTDKKWMCEIREGIENKDE